MLGMLLAAQRYFQSVVPADVRRLTSKPKSEMSLLTSAATKYLWCRLNKLLLGRSFHHNYGRNGALGAILSHVFRRLGF